MLPESYLHIVAITALAVTAYIAVVYMVSKALGRPQLTAYANLELYQLFLSALILVAAFGAFEFSKMASSALIGGDDPIQVSLEFISTIINQGIIPIYLKLVRMEVMLTYFNAVEYRMGPGVWNWITKAVPGMDPLISITRMLVFTFTALYGTMSIQIIIFNLINAIMYYYLLPAGIVLRFFPPTRDAGIYLIVMAIAFQSFFPLLYALNFAALTDMWETHGWIEEGQKYTPDIEHTNYFHSVNSWLGEAATLNDTYFSSWFLPIFQPFAFAALVPFLDRIAQISLVGLFLPAFSMTITIAFINALTKFITGKG